MRRIVPAVLVLFLLSPAFANDPALKAQALEALRKATAFYHGKVAAHGGYVYRYSDDLAKSEGEGKTTRDTVWVQPPGTPSVGLAYVQAYELTKEPALLAAAKDAAECLIQGQLRSGGWNDRVEFAPAARAKFSYRVDPPRKKNAFNVSTLDDDKSQSAIRFMVALDKALGFKDSRIHEATLLALDSLLKAQFPNGAWSQGWDAFPDPAKHPVKRAEYPASWPREYPGHNQYWFNYTFNDNSLADTIDTLLLAAKAYNEPRYRQAAIKGADFILLSQLPDPQPAWAQQYNYEMQPSWARKFEPPSITGSESQNLLNTLMRIYVETGDAKYLQPIPRALAYLKKSRLPDGQLARFYELRTNKPLYFTKDYVLTYDDSDMPTHYAFKVSSKLDAIEKRYNALRAMTPAQLATERSRTGNASRPTEAEVMAIIKALDARGAWVENGKLRYHGKGDPTTRVIESRTFIRNLEVLARYIAGT